MNSRDKILQELKQVSSAEVPLPDFDLPESVTDPVGQFCDVLQAIGGVIRQFENAEEWEAHWQALLAEGRRVVSGVASFRPVTYTDYAEANPESMEGVHTLVINGELGVAENGAVWISESKMGNRLLPFLCQHLVLVLDPKNIVPTLHTAYNLIKTDKDGYGVFIAGPSKTADIEQSLVLGAHGPLSLDVWLLDENAIRQLS